MDDLLDGLLEGAAEVVGGTVELAGEAAEWALDAAGELLDGGASNAEPGRRDSREEGERS